jgi:hypothetical protein
MSTIMPIQVGHTIEALVRIDNADFIGSKSSGSGKS